MPIESSFTLVYYLFTWLLLTANNILQLNNLCHIKHLAMLFKRILSYYDAGFSQLVLKMSIDNQNPKLSLFM